MHRFSWAIFLGMLLTAVVFVSRTVGELPRLVAVRFDDAGQAVSFIANGRYRIFILVLAVAIPLVLVSFMASAYSRATHVKVPNREYWLAPQRIARTRSFLITHGIWFGTLLVALMCFMHWLVLDANSRQPPELSNQSMFIGLLALLACMVVWIGTLMVAFRRPSGGG